MRCPNCGKDNNSVTDSRFKVMRDAWTRKRECNSCGYAFRTVERYSYDTIVEMHNERISYRKERDRINTERIKKMAREMSVKLIKD